MKKFGFIFYTVAILMLGTIIGGTLAYSAGKGCIIQYGDNKIDIAYLDKNTVQVHVYEPQLIDRIVHIGGGNTIYIHLK